MIIIMFWKHCFNKYATFYCIQIVKFESKSMKTKDFFYTRNTVSYGQNEQKYICVCMYVRSV